MNRDTASKFLRDLLTLMVGKGGSDLFITASSPPAMKVDGSVHRVTTHALTGQQTMAIARSIMSDHYAKEFERSKECNFAIGFANIGRFRVNAFLQQGHCGLVCRTIPTQIPSIDQLRLPEVLKRIAQTRRGLCLLVGATGSGKSTTLAAMIDHRNETCQDHIITLEDPVEFIHPHKQSLITQREVGTDTESWAAALKNCLRQAPDVILMGEIRDAETMGQAIQFAETGHLCLATLHANNANQAMDRIINFFPEGRRAQLLTDLSMNLKAVVSQRLLPSSIGRGRVPVVEVLINSPLIADLIHKGEVAAIKDVMKKSTGVGMQTFDQALFSAYEAGTISLDSALRNADSVNDLRLTIKLKSQRAQCRDLSAGTEHLAVL